MISNRTPFFLTIVRMISRSCVREKMPAMASKEKNQTFNIEPKVDVPVETDTEKLAKYLCGSNLFIDGGEDVKLKDDSEYPDWLWKIRSPPPLEELDKKSKTYWNRIKKMRETEIKYHKKLIRYKTVHK